MRASPKFDVICLGRAGVDLYAEQIGSRLEDVQSFAKYIGGSSCNMAAMTARLGLKSSMLTRVGNEHMGRFIRETLQAEGVDVSHVKTDPVRLTALVILGIKDQETFPLIFYRENCADMAISSEDFDEDYIASAQALVITGTHLSTAHTLQTCKTALEYAKRNSVKRVLDIDYRPVLWGLTGKGEGENRFVADQGVTQHLQVVIGEFDLIVGTEEEFHIAGGSSDTLAALREVRNKTNAVLVLKRGAFGATVFENAIPASLDDGITIQGVRVEVLNVLGAGDAFMSGFLLGWLNNKTYEQCLTYANACGALVVSRHGCTPAMPTREELENYLERKDNVPRPDQDATLHYLHRMTTRKREWDNLNILAFDHRSQCIDMAHAAGAPLERISQLKALVLAAVERAEQSGKIQGQIGMLLDEQFAQSSLNKATGRGWWVARPVEAPGSRPLAFEQGDEVLAKLAHWPEEQIVKCLVFSHPDDDSTLRHQQEHKLQTLYKTCEIARRELLLEVIPPADSKVDDYTLSRQIQRFYNLGIFPDWWKLPAMSLNTYHNIEAVIDARSPHCRGIVLLGKDAPIDKIIQQFSIVKKAKYIKGFAIGRTIFSEPAKEWFAGKLSDEACISAICDNYLAVAHAWQEAIQGRKAA